METRNPTLENAMFTTTFREVEEKDIFIHEGGIFEKRTAFGRDFKQEFRLQLTDFNAVQLDGGDKFEFEDEEEVTLLGEEV